LPPEQLQLSTRRLAAVGSREEDRALNAGESGHSRRQRSSCATAVLVLSKAHDSLPVRLSPQSLRAARRRGDERTADEATAASESWVSTVFVVRVRRRGVTSGMDGTAKGGEADSASVGSIPVDGGTTAEFEWTAMVGRAIFCPSSTSSFTASSPLCPHCTQHTPARMSAAPISQLDERDSENRLAPHTPCNRKGIGEAQGKDQQTMTISLRYMGLAVSCCCSCSAPTDRKDNGCTLIVRGCHQRRRCVH